MNDEDSEAETDGTKKGSHHITDMKIYQTNSLY